VCIKYRMIINDVSDYINVLVRIAHIICNHSIHLRQWTVSNILSCNSSIRCLTCRSLKGSRGSSVSVATRLGVRRPEFYLWQGQGRIFFPFATGSTPTLGPSQPSIRWIPEVKRPGHVDDHSSLRGCNQKFPDFVITK
jgi:hypothetical protein